MRPRALSELGEHLSFHKLLQGSRFLVLIPVVSLIIASAAVFVWGSVKEVTAIIQLAQHRESSAEVSVAFIQLMDVFLVAVGLLIFGLGLEQLFIAELEVPGWLKLRTLHDLKARLSSIIVLVMAIVFLDYLVEGKSALDLLYLGIAVASVAVALIAFGHFGEKE
jgi:uncharacterized membrane protein YqhA